MQNTLTHAQIFSTNYSILQVTHDDDDDFTTSQDIKHDFYDAISNALSHVFLSHTRCCVVSFACLAIPIAATPLSDFLFACIYI